ncbi:hypothetical protein IMG5_157710, partial [Ichthyophthirius multifiliis]
NTKNYTKLYEKVENEIFAIIYLKELINIEIKNLKINKIECQNGNNYFIYQQTIQSIQINNIIFENSKNISFLFSTNSYETEDNTYTFQQDFCQISDSIFRNLVQLQFPVIQIQQSYSQNFTQNLFQDIQTSAINGGAILFNNTSTTLLQQNFFYNCVAINGGALAFLQNIVNFKQQIIDSIFEKCKAESSAGAIFIENTNLQIINTTFSLNTAYIGGAVRYFEQMPLFIKQMVMQNHLTSVSFLKNKAELYGDDIASFPINIEILLDKKEGSEMELIEEEDSLITKQETEKKVIKKYTLKNFKSGQTLSLQFKLKDQKNQNISFSVQKVLNKEYPFQIVKELQEYNIKISPSNENEIKIFGQYITDYQKFDDKNYLFSIKDLMVVSNPSPQNFLLVESSAIQRLQPFFLEQDLIYNGPYYTKISIQFSECSSGEIYQKQAQIFICLECKEGTYSIGKPSKENYEKDTCKKCPFQAEKCYRDQILLKQGIWRISNTTDLLIECINEKSNCNGDYSTFYCTQGHIGPLCEECDVYGVLWDQRYQRNNNLECINCQSIDKWYYLIPIFFFQLGIVVYIILAIKISLQISKFIAIGYYMRRLNVLNIYKSAYKDTTDMNMKALVNYLQITQFVNTFEYQLPSFMTFLPKYLGSPIKNILYSFDCYFTQQNSKKEVYPIVFVRNTWSLLVPIFYLVIIFIIYVVFVKIKLFKHRRSYMINGFVFIIFFLQPNLTQVFLTMMSCRKIGIKKYILSDITYECYTDLHWKYIAIICFPGLFIWALFIPIFIIKIIIKNKEKLDYATNRHRYGFLYQDFKYQYFYWEFIKIYKKLLIVATLNFYEGPYMNKLIIILVLFLIYQILLNKKQPYLMNYFQQLDKKSITIIIILILMNIFLYNDP